MWIVCLAGAISLFLYLPAYPAGRLQGVSAVDLLRNSPTVRVLLLVDVRPGASFSRVRIPRSVNIPLFAVKSKNFLRDKDVVLVNEGFQISIFDQECRALQTGVMRSVRVLEGGIVSWSATGRHESGGNQGWGREWPTTSRNWRRKGGERLIARVRVEVFSD